MCICINCIYINSCIQYSIIEKNHKEKFFNPYASFEPVSPIINVNLYNKNNSIDIDWDLIECLSFVESPGKWLNKVNRFR
uniref:Conserved hypothetical plastid protein n=1 Tax=Flintiella sanguinaria TaxID=101926 RepID=A0A1X9PW04_9RHOD|nr:conserved hypothetical plastid protein [Flintiella sanguinaria]